MKTQAMKAEHTPGPWRVERNGARDFSIRADNDPNPQLYCKVEMGWGEGAAEACRANAALIASAPELLAALRGLLPLAELGAPPPSHKGSCGPDAGCDAGCMDAAHAANAIARARAALASATPKAGQ